MIFRIIHQIPFGADETLDRDGVRGDLYGLRWRGFSVALALLRRGCRCIRTHIDALRHESRIAARVLRRLQLQPGSQCPLCSQIAPQDLEKVLTPEQVEFLSEKSGMTREELLAGLSQQLPKVVDTLTPEGRIPAAHELDRA